ncbi:BTB/POZ domain-containing protein 3-like [Rhodnius prolixus]|uniref:BTB/POZ domain-containing protein 3-like n=1 Tax=Rhodnius prolixus TaxID=13249 RepID=UPI003D18A476
MCPNDNAASPHQPLMSRLFDSEAGSDVTFLVGHEPETWRFPGHRCVLMEANPVFKAMLCREPDEQQVVIPILDVDGRAFDILLRYLYKEDVHLQSVSTALSTLYAAQKYLCPGLMRQCIAYLDSCMDVTNVLQIYEHIRVYSGQSKVASAPPIEQITATPDRNDNFDTMLILCNSLLHNCLLFIDSNAVDIFNQESFEDLKRDSMYEIIARDTLYAPEIVIYQALERWCNRECKRHHLELCQENKRCVLGDEILFSVRYLVMTDEDYYCGPIQGSLLSNNEKNILLGYLRNYKAVTNTSSTLTDSRLAKFRQRRVLPNTKRILLGQKCSEERSKKGKLKKQKKKESKSSSNNTSSSGEGPSSSPKRCSGTCVADYVFRALACIFD